MEGSTGLIPGPLLGMWLRSRWVGAWWEDTREEGVGGRVPDGRSGEEGQTDREKERWLDRETERGRGGGGGTLVKPFLQHM